MSGDNRTTAARSFLRSLNILLKFTRLYGFEHVRTAAQLKTAWTELMSAIAKGKGMEGGLLLGVSESKLLLDGVPIEAAPAERSFAELMTQAGLSSLCFTSSVTPHEFTELVKAFTLAGSKAAEVSERLKASLGNNARSGIKINEIRFVAEDSGNPRATMAAELAAQSMGGSPSQIQELMNDPQKLLQMIVAAEGDANTGGGASGPGTGGGGGTGGVSGMGGSGVGRVGGSGATVGAGGFGVINGGSGTSGGGGTGGFGVVGGGSGTGGRSGTGGFGVIAGGSGTGGGQAGGVPDAGVHEEDVVNVVRLLREVQSASLQQGSKPDQGVLRTEFSRLTVSAQDLLREGLANLPKTGQTEANTLLKLAEHMAIRVAMKRYERGEVKVNAVRQMLDRMGSEIDNLRKILKAHEDKMSKSGVVIESHAEILDRQFWAAVPETGKRAVLMSAEAYCIPARNVRQFVTQLLEQGEISEAVSILMNYAGCVHSKEPEARRRTAMGLSELAELYAKTAKDLLTHALELVGKQAAEEQIKELQLHLGAAFARLSQEACSRRDFVAMKEALEGLSRMEKGQAALAESLRPRIGVENRLGEFMEDAIRGKSSAELIEVLRRIPRAAAEHAAARFSRSEKREECQRLTELVKDIGEGAVSHLRTMLHERPPAEAAIATGIMSMLDVPALQTELLARLPGWDRAYHDSVVRQIAAAGAAERGKLLVALMERLDPIVWSEVVDEIGMCGDMEMAPVLLPLAQGERRDAAGAYIQVKAIEALGRLRAADAAPVLRKMVEERLLFRWAQPNEVRIVAAQAMKRIDPAWAASYLPKSGLDTSDLEMAPLDAQPDAAWLRQRRYARVTLPKTMSVVAETSHGEYRMTAQLLSMGGGLATAESRLTAGVQAMLKIQTGLRPLKARVLMRKAGPQHVGFEFVEMELEERARLRKLLAGIGKPSSVVSLSLETPKAAVA